MTCFSTPSYLLHTCDKIWGRKQKPATVITLSDSNSESQQGDGRHWTDCTVPPFHFEVCLRLCWPSEVQQWVTTQDVLHPNPLFFRLLLLLLRTRNGYIIFLGHFSPIVGRDTHYLALNTHTDGALILSSDFSECLGLAYKEIKDRSRDTVQSLTLLINCQTSNTHIGST